MNANESNRLNRQAPVGNGERDRPGRPGRRLADRTARGDAARRVSVSPTGVFGRRPKTAGATPALPEPTAANALSPPEHGRGTAKHSKLCGLVFDRSGESFRVVLPLVAGLGIVISAMLFNGCAKRSAPLTSLPTASPAPAPVAAPISPPPTQGGGAAPMGVFPGQVINQSVVPFPINGKMPILGTVIGDARIRQLARPGPPGSFPSPDEELWILARGGDSTVAHPTTKAPGSGALMAKIEGEGGPDAAQAHRRPRLRQRLHRHGRGHAAIPESLTPARSRRYTSSRCRTTPPSTSSS